MKTFAFSLSLLSLILSSTVRAEEEIRFFTSNSTEASIPTPVDTNQLTLLGKGIRARHSTRNLALACVGAELENHSRKCDQLRWVYFEDNTATYIGRILKLNPEFDSDGTLTREYRKQIKQYLKSLSKEAKSSLPLKHNLGQYAVVIPGGIGTLVLGATIAASSGFGVGLLVFVAGGTAVGLIGTGIANPTKITTPNLLTRSTDQNGWNWSSHPRKVPVDYFDAVLRLLKTN